MSKRSTDSVLSVFNLSPRRIGGTEIYARELSIQLSEKGWRGIFCFNSPPSSHVMDFLGPADPVIEAAPGMHDSSLAMVRKLRPLLQKYRPRIVHSHYGSLISPVPWLGWLAAVEKSFYTEHTSRDEKAFACQAAWWKRLVARSLSPWDGIFCGSSYGASFLKERGYLAEDKIHTLYNATAVQDIPNAAERALEFRHRYGIPQNAMLIVQVGQLADYKGVTDLVDAFVLVRKKVDSAHLVLVGDGPLKDQLVLKAKALGVNAHITLTGLVENPISDGVYHASDICCQVSRWQELFGFTIAEAMVCQRPVVGTSVGGIPEVITDGVTGYLTPKRDVLQIADRIVTLAKDADMRARMGAAGREKVTRKFNVKNNVARMLELYGIFD